MCVFDRKTGFTCAPTGRDCEFVACHSGYCFFLSVCCGSDSVAVLRAHNFAASAIRLCECACVRACVRAMCNSIFIDFAFGARTKGDL